LKDAESLNVTNAQQISFERESFAMKVKAIEKEKEEELQKQKENSEMFFQYEKERMLQERNAESEKASLMYVCYHCSIFSCC
jgi:hypothetical protein